MANVWTVSPQVLTDTPTSLGYASCSPKIWRDVILPQVEKCERKSFTTTEIFDFKFELKKKNVSMIAMLKDGEHPAQVMGYMVLMTPKFGRTITLHKICVQRENRRQGLARMMLSAQIENSRQQSTSRILLWVRRDNVSAIKLYETLGFENVSENQDYYGPGQPGIHMALDL